MKLDLRQLCFREIIKKQVSVFGREFLQAFIQAFAGKALLNRFFGRDRDVVYVDMNSRLSQRFAIDVSGNTVTVSDLVLDSLFGTFQDNAIDGLVGQIIGELALAVRKEGGQAEPQALVFLGGALRIRTEPLEEASKLLRC
ncbi:MAG: hypothetical protein QOJ64_3497 [Acidobacteriota bacterium]|nr:hypothetical protein [Acidobacteriota bacterium]